MAKSKRWAALYNGNRSIEECKRDTMRMELLITRTRGEKTTRSAMAEGD
jgi:hypothetical protein